MKRAWMAGTGLLLASQLAMAQGLDLPDPAAAPAKKEEKKDAKKADPLGLPEPPDAKAAAKKDSLDLPAIDAKPAAKAAKDAKAKAKADPLLDLPPLDAKPAAKEAAKKDDLGGLDALAPKEAKPAAKDAKAAAPPAPAAPAAAPAAPPAPAPAQAGAKDAKAGAAAAAEKPATRAVTAEKAAPPAAAAPAPVAAAVAAQAPREKGPWDASLYAGAERGSERYLDGNTSLTRLGLAGDWRFSGAWHASAAFDFRSSVQGYVINRPSADGSPRAPAQLDEQRYDGVLGVGYDAGPKLLENGRLVLVPQLLVRYINIQNKAFPTSFIGLEARAQSSFLLSPAVTLHATVSYAFNFTESTTQSAVGAPKGHFGATAGLKLPLEGGYALEFDYVGDILAFRNVYRVAHGGALGFSTTF